MRYQNNPELTELLKAYPLLARLIEFELDETRFQNLLDEVILQHPTESADHLRNRAAYRVLVLSNARVVKPELTGQVLLTTSAQLLELHTQSLEAQQAHQSEVKAGLTELDTRFADLTGQVSKSTKVVGQEFNAFYTRMNSAEKVHADQHLLLSQSIGQLADALKWSFKWVFILLGALILLTLVAPHLHAQTNTCIALATNPSLVSGQRAPCHLTLDGATVVTFGATSITITGTATANQGTANSAANRWPFYLTDGTNTMPTGDAAARTIHVTTDNASSVVTSAASSSLQSITYEFPCAKAAFKTGAATATTATNTSVIAAQGGSNKLYVYSAQVANTGATTSLITFTDGSGGTTLSYTINPTGAGSNILFRPPLVTSANTGFFVTTGSASTTMYFSAQACVEP